ncbi:linoleate 13S-lipoxygenase 2-1, chloroplastic-like protein, partial [Tanacetum coccineum]
VHIPIPHNILPRFIKKIVDGEDTIIQFTSSEIINRILPWMLAGANPCSIQLVTEWPLKSKLNPNVCGPAESKFTKDDVENKIRGFITFEEAYAQKKLFMLDYHDLLLPYVTDTRKIKGTTLYGSRTLLFLTPDGTLMPVAIELTRPKSGNKPQWNHVYQPTSHATDAWLWKLAKAHVLAHDSAHHQLVSHWLRTHCVSEPYIISTHRNLSQVHPIYRLHYCSLILDSQCKSML